MASLALVAGISASCGGEVVNSPGSGGQSTSSAGGGAPTSTTGHGGHPTTATAGGAGLGGAATGGGGAATGGGGAATGSGGAGGAAQMGVACGAIACGASEECLVCDPADPDPEKQCVPHFGGMCGAWGMFPPLRIACEGPEDCDAGETCAVVEGSLGTYTTCQPSGVCADPCSNCFAHFVCRTLADCPSCATSCTPYHAPSYPVSVCTF